MLPTYQQKVRALTTIKDFLKENRLKLANRYTFKVMAAYDGPVTNKWAMKTITSYGLR